MQADSLEVKNVNVRVTQLEAGHLSHGLLSTLQSIWKAHGFKSHLIEQRPFQSFISTIIVLSDWGSSIKDIFHLGRRRTPVTERDMGNIISVTCAFLQVEQHDSQSALIPSNIFIHLLVPWWSVGRRDANPLDDVKGKRWSLRTFTSLQCQAVEEHPNCQHPQSDETLHTCAAAAAVKADH